MAAPVTGGKAALSVATVLSGCCALCLQPISGPHSDTASFVMQDGHGVSQCLTAEPMCCTSCAATSCVDRWRRRKSSCL
jgi:hypothetical protein